MDQTDAAIHRSLQPVRVTISAMVVGMGTFAVVAIALDEQIADRPDLTPILLVVLILLAVGELIGYLPFRRSKMAKLRGLLDQGGEAPALTQHVVSLWVIPAAIAEGLGLLAIVIFLLTGNAVVLAAAALALLILLALLPTRDRVAQFVSHLRSRPFGS